MLDLEIHGAECAIGPANERPNIVVHHGSREQQHLLDLAKAEPSPEAWWTLCNAMDACDPGVLDDVIVTLDRVLRAWPDALRMPSDPWLHGLIDKQLHPGLFVVRRWPKVLASIDLSDSDVQSVKPLQHHVALKMLNLSDTRVTDVSPLQHLSMLQDLDLSATRVADLEPLKHLMQLQTLNVMNSQVTTVEPIQHLVDAGLVVIHEDL